jgi:hypothetical protein
MGDRPEENPTWDCFSSLSAYPDLVKDSQPGVV